MLKFAIDFLSCGDDRTENDDDDDDDDEKELVELEDTVDGDCGGGEAGVGFEETLVASEALLVLEFETARLDFC